MDFAEVVAAEELWGWPVGVLDRLAEMRRQAEAGVISLAEWREQDASLRAGLPAVDQEKVREFHTEWLVDGPFDVSDDSYERVNSRLSVLTRPAPSDDELWHELAEVLNYQDDPEFKQRRRQETVRARRERIAAWLTRPGSGLDPVSGLPWAEIERYRVVEHPDLGPVPLYVETARQLALTDASEADRRRASMIAVDQSDKLAALEAEINAERFTWLPNLLVEAAREDTSLQPLLADQLRILADPRVQQLIMKTSALGWPAAVPERS